LLLHCLPYHRALRAQAPPQERKEEGRGQRRRQKKGALKTGRRRAAIFAFFHERRQKGGHPLPFFFPLARAPRFVVGRRAAPKNFLASRGVFCVFSRTEGKRWSPPLPKKKKGRTVGQKKSRRSFSVFFFRIAGPLAFLPRRRSFVLRKQHHPPFLSPKMLPARFLDIAASAALRVFGGDAVAAAEFLAGAPKRKREDVDLDEFRAFLRVRYNGIDPSELTPRAVLRYQRDLELEGQDDMTPLQAQAVIPFEYAKTDGDFDALANVINRRALLRAFEEHQRGQWDEKFEAFIDVLIVERDTKEGDFYSQNDEANAKETARKANKKAKDANFQAKFSDAGMDLRIVAAVQLVFDIRVTSAAIKRAQAYKATAINMNLLEDDGGEPDLKRQNADPTERSEGDVDASTSGTEEFNTFYDEPLGLPAPPAVAPSQQHARRQQEAQYSDEDEYSQDPREEAGQISESDGGSASGGDTVADEFQPSSPSPTFRQGSLSEKELEIAAEELGGDFVLPEGELPLGVDRREFERVRADRKRNIYRLEYDPNKLSSELKTFLSDIVRGRAIEVFKNAPNNSLTLATFRGFLELTREWPAPEWVKSGYEAYMRPLREDVMPPSSQRDPYSFQSMTDSDDEDEEQQGNRGNADPPSVHELSSYNSDDALVDQKQENPRWPEISGKWLRFLGGLEKQTEQVTALRKVFQRKDDLVIFKHDKDTFRPSDLESLRGTKWLNDKVVNTYLQRHSERAPLKNCIVLDSVWFDRMVAGSEGGSVVARVTQALGRFRPGTGLLMVPVNVNKIHWVLLWADFSSKKIVWADSMNSNGTLTTGEKQMVDAFEVFLSRVTGDVRRWTRKILKAWVDIPGQNNTYDCGIFVIRLGKAILDECDLDAREEVDSAKARVAIALDMATMGEGENRIEYQVCAPPARQATPQSSPGSDSGGIDALIYAKFDERLPWRRSNATPRSPALKTLSKEVEMANAPGDVDNAGLFAEMPGKVRFNTQRDRRHYLPYVLMLKHENFTTPKGISKSGPEQLYAVDQLLRETGVIPLDATSPSHGAFTGWKRDDLNGVKLPEPARNMRAVFENLRPERVYDDEIARAVRKMIIADQSARVYQRILFGDDAPGSALTADYDVDNEKPLDPIARGIVEAHGDRNPYSLKPEFTAVRRALSEIREARAPKVPRRGGENAQRSKPVEAVRPTDAKKSDKKRDKNDKTRANKELAAPYFKMLGAKASTDKNSLRNFASPPALKRIIPDSEWENDELSRKIFKPFGTAPATSTFTEWRKYFVDLSADKKKAIQIPRVDERVRVFNLFFGKRKTPLDPVRYLRAVKQAIGSEREDRDAVFKAATGAELSAPIAEVSRSPTGAEVAFAANIVDAVMEAETSAALNLTAALVLSRGNEALAARLLARLG
jgi:hypothetical protein